MGNNVDCAFQKLTADYIPLLYTWFKEPHVSRWWPTPERNEFFDKFLERIRSKDTIAYIACINNVPFGYIQYYRIDRAGEKTGKWLPPLPETTIGIDQFIGDPSYLGKGYGTAMIASFITYIKQIDPTLTTIILDPEPENGIAVKCYKKVGFKEVGIYQRQHGSALIMRYDF